MGERIVFCVFPMSKVYTAAWSGVSGLLVPSCLLSHSLPTGERLANRGHCAHNSG